MAQYGYMAKIGADTSGLQSALKNVDSQLSAIDREINATNKALKNAGTAGTDSFEMLNQKSTELCNAIAATETKLNDLRSVEEQMKSAAAVGSISAEEYRAYQREVSNTEAQLRTYQNQLKEVNSALYGLDEQTGNSSHSQEVFANSMLEVRAAAQKVSDDLAFFVDGIKNVGSATFKSVKEVAEYSVKVGSSFDSAMSQTAAYSGATAEQLEQLRNAAKDAGATTSKSATESAQALGYMSLAGWDVNEMLTGLMPMIRAAEAGSSDLARTSDLVTDSMSAMGLSTEELAHYLDICTTAQSNSNTTMNGLLEAYINCGGTLKNLNVPLEESATILGTLANRGKKASEAGTALNSILVNLIGANKSSKAALDELGVSAWDAEGNFIGLTNTLYLLDDALKNCTQQQRNFFEAKIGGKTQMDTLQAMLAGINDEYDSLYAKISDCDGALETTAVTMQSNLTGAITQMKSALEGVGNEIYEYLDEPLKEAVQSVTENLGTINESIKNGALGEALRNMSQSLSELIIKLADFAASRGIEMVIDGVSDLIDLLSWLADNAEKVTVAIGAMGAGFAAFKVGTLVADIVVLVTTVTNFAAAAQAGSVAAIALNTAITAFQFAGVIAVFAALTAAVIGLECAYYEAKIAADEAYISADNTILKLNESRRAYEEQSAEIEKNCEKIDDNTEAAKKNWQTLQDLCDEQGNIVGSSSEVQKAIDGLNEYLGTNIQVIDGQIQGYKELNKEMEGLIETMRLESKMRTMQPLYDEAISTLDDKTAQQEQASKDWASAMDKANSWQVKLNGLKTTGDYNSFVEEIKNQDDYSEFIRMMERNGKTNALKTATGLYDSEMGQDYIDYLAFKADNAQSTWWNSKKAADNAKKTISEYENLELSKYKYEEEPQNGGTEGEGNGNGDTGETEEDRQEKLDADLADLEKRKKLHRDELDDDKKYYAEKKKIIDEYSDLEDYSAYQNAYDDVYKYYNKSDAKKTSSAADKELEKQKKAAEKAAKEQQKAAEKQKKENEKAAEELRKANETAAKEQFDELKKSLDDGIISRQEFNDKYAALSDEWSQKSIDISKYTSEQIAKINKKQVENYNSDLEDAIDDVKKVYDDLASTRRKAADSMTSDALFDTVKTVDGEKPIFDDLSKRTEEINKYAADYAKLSQMDGVPPDLLEEIKSMSFDDRRAVVAELIKMSEKNRQAYFSDYSAYKKAAQNAAEIETAGQEAEAEKYAENRLGEVFADPDNAYVAGQSMGAEWLNGFSEALSGSNVMSMLGMGNIFEYAQNILSGQSHGAISVKTPIVINLGTSTIETTVYDILRGNGLAGRENAKI